jgi:PAS domain S-box-containing protein
MSSRKAFTLAEGSIKDVPSTEAFALLDTLIENAPIGLACFDQDYRFLRVNAALAQMYNLAASVLLGRAVQEIEPPLPPIAETFIRQVLETQQPLIDIELSADPHMQAEMQRYYLVSYYPIRTTDEQIQSVGAVVQDITERRRVQAALHESEERYRRLVELSPEPSAVHCNGELVYINPAGAQLVGARHPDDLIGRSILEFVHPDYRDQVVARVRQVQQEHQLGELAEEKFVRLDGGIINVEVVAIPTIYQGRAATHVVIRDITARKRAEEALRTSRDQLAVILQGVADGITVQDPSGQLIYANDAAAKACGYASAEALLAAPVSEVMQQFELRDTDGRPLPWDQLPGRRALQGIPSHNTIVRFHITATGEERWSSVASTPVFDEHGAVRLAVNIFHDITERKRAEIKERFLSEASHVLGSSLDYETTLNRIAKLAVPMLADWCRIDLVTDDSSPHVVTVVHSDPAKQELAQELRRRYILDSDAGYSYPHVIRTGQPELIAEIPDALLQAVAKDAEQLSMLRGLGLRSSISVPLIAHQRTLGALTFVMAESGRRYSADDLALVEELAHRAALAVDNARLYHEAQQAIRMRDQFLSIASHELKTPLTSLVGHAQLLQRRFQRGKEWTEQDERSVHTIVNQTARLQRMITTLLDISRIQTGQLSIECSAFDLRHLAARVAEDLQPSLKQHTLILKTDDDPLTIHGDELRLEQVFQNLLYNAIKYSPAGGQILLQLHQRDNHVVISVQDEGIGIPSEALPQLFQRFYRAPNAQEQDIQGFGIGLYVVNEIVSLHGGTIAVESMEGQGSTFTIRLPLASDSQPGSLLP